MRILLLLSVLITSIPAFGQVSWREATVAEMAAGTAGSPVAVTPRRAAGGTNSSGVVKSVYQNDLPYSIPNLGKWFRGDSFAAGLTNASQVASWPDLSIANSPFNAVGGGVGYFYRDGVNGRPALWLDGTSCFTNFGCMSGTNFTFTFVYQDYGESNTVATLGTDTNTWYAAFYINSFYNADQTVSSGARVQVGTNALSFVEAHVANRRLAFVTVEYDGTNVTFYLNGHFIQSQAYSKSLPSNLLHLSGLKGQANPWQGFIAEVIAYDRALSPAEIQRLHNYIHDRYLAGNSEIILDGTSITVGTRPSIKGGLANVLFTNLTQNFDITEIALSGQTSSQRTNNLMNWSGDRHSGGRTIVYLEIGVNDFRNSVALAVVQTNVINYSTALRQLGDLVILATPLTHTNEQTGLNSRTNYAAWLRANYANFADGLVDYANDPLIGAQGGFTNTTYFSPDWIHPTNACYVLMASYLVPVINQVAGLTTGNFHGTFEGNGSSLTNGFQNTITPTNFLTATVFTNTTTRNQNVVVNARCNPTTTGNALYRLIVSPTGAGNAFSLTNQAGCEADAIFTTAPHIWSTASAVVPSGGLYKILDVSGEGLFTITNSYTQTLQ